MSPTNLSTLWTNYLAGDLSAADEAQLVATLNVDMESRNSALRDAEMDGMLRSLGHANDSERGEQFVASVLQRIATSNPLDSRLAETNSLSDAPPPPVIEQSSIADLPIAEAIDPPPPVIDAVSPAITIGSPSTRRHRKYRSQVVATIVAAIAATVLIVLVASNRNSEPGLAESNETPAQSDKVSDEPEAIRPTPPSVSPNGTLAEGDLPGASDPLVPGRDPNAIASDAAPQIPPSIPPRGQPQSNPRFAVLIGGSEDVKWYELPRDLTGQSLNLQAGTAEFRMASGATVSVTGPSHFQIDSPNSLILASGFTSAEVPPEAVGFAVDTPTARIIDLGTSFDVRVAPTKGLSVRVVKGKVALEPVADKAKRLNVHEGEHKFIDSDGTILDWKVEINADVFGDITAYIDGQRFDVQSQAEFEALEHELFDRDTNVWRRPSVTNNSRYVFNGRVEESHDIASGVALLKSVMNDLSGLQWIIRDANAEQGAYRVKDRIYKYSNLKEKLQVRRDIARIHGSLAVGKSRFFEHEKFDTTISDGLKLYELQRAMIKRLDVGAEQQLPGFPNIGNAQAVIEIKPGSASVTINSNAQQPQQPQRGSKDPVIIEPKNDNAANQFDTTTEKQQRADREAAFKQLEEIRQRKRSDRATVPANSLPAVPEVDAPAKRVQPVANAVADPKSVLADAVIAVSGQQQHAAGPLVESDAAVIAALEDFMGSMAAPLSMELAGCRVLRFIT